MNLVTLKRKVGLTPDTRKLYPEYRIIVPGYRAFIVNSAAHQTLKVPGWQLGRVYWSNILPGYIFDIGTQTVYTRAGWSAAWDGDECSGMNMIGLFPGDELRGPNDLVARVERRIAPHEAVNQLELLLKLHRLIRPEDSRMELVKSWLREIVSFQGGTPSFGKYLVEFELPKFFDGRCSIFDEGAAAAKAHEAGLRAIFSVNTVCEIERICLKTFTWLADEGLPDELKSQYQDVCAKTLPWKKEFRALYQTKEI